MDAAYKIMQLDYPDDFIIATGEANSVKDFLDEAFKFVNLDSNKHVKFDKNLSRSNDTNLLIGDYSKANKAFGFTPKIKFKQIIKIMVENDLKIFGK